MTVVGGTCESLGGPVLLPLAPKHPPLGPGRILTEDSRESMEEVELFWPWAQPEDARSLYVPWGDPHRRGQENGGGWQRAEKPRQEAPKRPTLWQGHVGGHGLPWPPRCPGDLVGWVYTAKSTGPPSFR